MATVWFTLLALMLAAYVVLDGFDFGAGMLHLFVARTDSERRTVLAAIGPFWDGNEVWLVASGGVLVFVFPRAYAAGFSGFYLPMMMTLWLIILRGISIEFRSQQENTLWRSFWDGLFCVSSTLMALILGVALGNVIRGVPLDGSGYFRGPLFTNFLTGERPGALDWYTVLVGVFAVLTLAAHGAVYLSYKTSGQVLDRSLWVAARLWGAVIFTGALTTVATYLVRPELYANLMRRPWTLLIVIAIGASLAVLFVSLKRKAEASAFLASCAFIASLLAGTAAGLYPSILTSTLNRQNDLTVANASTGALGLQTGLIWWTPAIILAIVYFIFLFYSFRGKVTSEGGSHGY